MTPSSEMLSLTMILPIAFPATVSVVEHSVRQQWAGQPTTGTGLFVVERSAGQCPGSR
jgi:hypothetical protein